MSKGLILGLIAGAAAATAAAVYFKKKQDEYRYYDEEDVNADFECDSCCGECCECGDDCDCECTEIPAEKAEESVIVTDACVACGNSEEEALAAIEDEVESDEV